MPATVGSKAKKVEVAIENLDASAFVVPTDFPQADGTLAWDKTTLVVVEATGGGKQSLGYTYADTATALLIKDLIYFRRMLETGAVDVLQADATRCAGITGFLRAATLCEANSIPLSAHCAPSLHAHPCCALRPARHVEYFHDHVRIEHMLFDGALHPVNGELRPDLSRPGIGLELKSADAARYAI